MLHRYGVVKVIPLWPWGDEVVAGMSCLTSSSI